jgi:hypothetical protein
MVVGPPGTGKTDTAVQVVNLLFHNFPDQKIVLVAHSNQALNDLFTKIVALDIPERYLLRLGRGIDEIKFHGGPVLSVEVTDENGETVVGGWDNHTQTWTPTDALDTVDTTLKVKICEDPDHMTFVNAHFKVFTHQPLALPPSPPSPPPWDLMGSWYNNAKGAKITPSANKQPCGDLIIEPGPARVWHRVALFGAAVKSVEVADMDGNQIDGSWDPSTQTFTLWYPRDTMRSLTLKVCKEPSAPASSLEGDVVGYFSVQPLPGPDDVPTWKFTGTWGPPDPACANDPSCYKITGSANAEEKGELTQCPGPKRGFVELKFHGGPVKTCVVQDEDGKAVDGTFSEKGQVWKPTDPQDTIDTCVTVKITEDPDHKTFVNGHFTTLPTATASTSGPVPWIVTGTSNTIPTCSGADCDLITGSSEPPLQPGQLVFLPKNKPLVDIVFQGSPLEEVGIQNPESGKEIPGTFDPKTQTFTPEDPSSLQNVPLILTVMPKGPFDAPIIVKIIFIESVPSSPPLAALPPRAPSPPALPLAAPEVWDFTGSWHNNPKGANIIGSGGNKGEAGKLIVEPMECRVWNRAWFTAKGEPAPITKLLVTDTDGNEILGDFDMPTKTFTPAHPKDTMKRLTITATEGTLTDINAHFTAEALPCMPPAPPGSPAPPPTWKLTGTWGPVELSCLAHPSCWHIAGSQNTDPCGVLPMDPGAGRGFIAIKFTGGPVKSAEITIDATGKPLDGTFDEKAQTWTPSRIPFPHSGGWYRAGWGVLAIGAAIVASRA